MITLNGREMAEMSQFPPRMNQTKIQGKTPKDTGHHHTGLMLMWGNLRRLQLGSFLKFLGVRIRDRNTQQNVDKPPPFEQNIPCLGTFYRKSFPIAFT